MQYLLQALLGKAVQQRYSLGEALFEIELSPHGSSGDCRHPISNIMQLSKFVNDLGLNQRRIHVKSDQAPVAAIDALPLKRDINLELVSKLHEFGAQRGRSVSSAADFKLDAGIRIARRTCQGEPAG